MIVVLDTTEFFSDLRLRSPNFRLLAAFLSLTRARFVVPQVVVDETVNHFREQLAEQVRVAASCQRKIRKLMGDGEWCGVTGIDEVCEVGKYRQFLRDEIKAIGGTITDNDGINVDRLIERALDRRKPFDAQGHRGFRDAVLWESIRKEITASSADMLPVVFVSSNTNDFGTNGVIYPELAAECPVTSSGGASIILWAGLQAFVDKDVKPRLKSPEGIHHELVETGHYRGFVPSEFFKLSAKTIKAEIAVVVKRYDFSRQMQRMYESFEKPCLHSMATQPDEWEVTEIRELDAKSVAIDLRFVIKGEVACLQAEVSHYRSDDGTYYEDHFLSEFAGDAKFNLVMTVIVETEGGEVEDFEVHAVETKLGENWPWRDYV